MRYVMLDFETSSSSDLKKCGAWEYANHWDTMVISIGYKIVDTEGPPHSTRVIYGARCCQVDEDFLSLVVDEKTMFLAHNTAFEISIWRGVMMGYGYPDIPNYRWHDTMAVAAKRGLPMSLEALGPVLGLRTIKDMEGHKIMLKMCKPTAAGEYAHTEENFKILNRYNIADVDTQNEAHIKLGGLGASERAYWLLDQKINQRGFRVDRFFIKSCLAIIEQSRVPATRRFRQIVGPINPTQRNKFLIWLGNNGLPLDDLKKETVDAIINGDGDIEAEVSPGVLEALKIRRALSSTSLGKLDRMYWCSEYDGRVRYTTQYHGARTGRAAGRNVQIQNFPRGSLGNTNLAELVAAINTRNIDNVASVWGHDTYDAVITCLRACIIPSDGHKFVVSDFSGIEARVIMALAGQWNIVDMMADGEDIYCELASRIFGFTVDKNNNPRERHLGKSGVLGSQYGIGPKGFQARFIPGEPIEIANRIVDTYRTKFAPEVAKFWHKLFDASVAAVKCPLAKEYSIHCAKFRRINGFLLMKLPSGREISYHLPQYVAANEDAGVFRDTWSYMEYKGASAVRKTAWYGGITNHLVQGVARDLLYHALANCESNELLSPVFTVHDEIVCEAKEHIEDSVLLEAIERAMVDIPQWAKDLGLKIDCESHVMARYGK